MLIVKVGGGKTINWTSVCKDIAQLNSDEQVILVHGASETRDEIAERMGLKTKTVVSPSGISSVYTDQEALEVFLMAYAGLVNKQIVARLQQVGVNAVGLSGVDGKLWTAKPKKELYVQEDGKTRLITDNLTGRVEQVNGELLKTLLDTGYVPVVCPPAISFEGQIVNTDNDWAIGVMAKALDCKRLVVLFEEEGLLQNFEDKSSVIKELKYGDLEKALEYAQGRMKKKLLGAKKALELGVEEIFWGDGRKEHPISSALAGEGTVIRK